MTSKKQFRNNIYNWIFQNKKYEIQITWRFFLYIMLISITMYLNLNAVEGYYEHKPFTGLVFLLTGLSYIYSIFLIKPKEVNEQ